MSKKIEKLGSALIIDSSDHLHPNDAGYLAIAAAIDLRWFTQPHGLCVSGLHVVEITI